MKRNTAIIGAIVSGICIYTAVLHAVAFLAWIALVPLFLVIDQRPRFLPGLVAGAAFSACAFTWVIPGAHAFTGASFGYGIALFLLCVSVFSLGCATLLWLTPPVLVAPVWILAEILLQWVAEKMPWFLFHIGSAVAASDYAIQPVSVIGVAGAGFVVITVNYLTALAIRRRSWKHTLAPLLLFAGYMAWGWWLMPPEGEAQGPSFTLALLTENIPPGIPWDQATGNQRVQELLQQEDRCLAGHPQLILWTESAIPWTYSAGDDLLGEVLRHSKAQSVTHVLGMNTAVSNNLVRNSAYCLLPDGSVAGRYDKTKPLLFIEQPALGLQFPFYSSGGYSVEPGDSDRPLITPYGKAGVLICNESALPGAAASRVKQGAQFLLNLSNDGWFRDSWLVAQHFYNARLRAVETRRDMAVNSNNGWCGAIYASGRIDTTGFVYPIHPRNNRTIAVRYPLLPAFICLLALLTILIIYQKNKLL